ncbi:MAG: histidine phosphatase family protein [Solirubrobacteraceae bacterium]|nr:histidine phosphatase family protein [Patulibacter sp.]
MSVLILVRHGQATFGMGTYDRLSDHGQAQARRLGEVLNLRGVKVDRIVSGDLDRQRETAEILSSSLGGRPTAIDPAWNEYDHMPLIARVKPMYRKHWLMVADLARTGNPNRRLQEIIDKALLHWVAQDARPEDAATALRLAAQVDAGDDEGPDEAAQAVIDPRDGSVVRRPPAGDHELDLPAAPAGDGVETFTQYNDRITAALDATSQQSGTTLVVSSAGTIAAAIAPLIGIPSHRWPGLHRVMVNTSVTKVVRGQRGISLISFNDHGHLEGAPGVKVTYR